MLKLCKHCNKEKPQEQFVKSKITKSGYRGICKECFNLYYQQRRVEQYDKVRGYEKKFHLKRRLKHNYNLSLEEYTVLQEEQGGYCLLCNSNATKLVVDHCHTTGKVRGLLCHHCNVGLGHFKDNQQTLQRAIEYLNGS